MPRLSGDRIYTARAYGCRRGAEVDQHMVSSERDETELCDSCTW